MAGCQSIPASSLAPPAGAGRDAHSLTLIVAELQMHLRDDTYRSFRAAGEGGRDVFQTALWRLDRLQASRLLPREQWTNVDLVIEYARARALERSRRYREARAAYERVATAGSLLQRPAEEAAAVMRRFEPHSGRLLASAAENQSAWLAERIEAWQILSWEYRRTSYEPLALEEAEAWGMLRLDRLQRESGLEAAIDSCHRLIERNRTSKLYARHLIRLGDLYAEAARLEHVRSQVEQARFDARRYDQLLDHAFSAYELAGEERRPVLRTEAAKKIEALLAAHRGVASGVR